MDDDCSCHETSPLLRDSLLRLAACAEHLAAADAERPDREAVTRYLDALELAICHCFARPELGRWLDVLCPLKKNLRSLREYAESAEPARMNPRLVTAAVVLTHLTLSLEQRPGEVLVRDVLLDLMGADFWAWPLPRDARVELQAQFDTALAPCPASPTGCSFTSCSAACSRPVQSSPPDHPSRAASAPA